MLSRKQIWWSLLCVLAVSFLAQTAMAATSCTDLKTKIEDGLKAKGVQAYTLTVVPNAEADKAAGKVVGSCDGGTQKIVYSRSSSAAAEAPAPAAAAPSAPPAASKKPAASK